MIWIHSGQDWAYPSEECLVGTQPCNFDVKMRCYQEDCICTQAALLITGEELSFVFTSIDPKDNARQFAFGVKVQEGQTYTGRHSHCQDLYLRQWCTHSKHIKECTLCCAVTTCEPPINALDGLVQSLNKGTIQFSAFVQKMRRQFQHLC